MILIPLFITTTVLFAVLSFLLYRNSVEAAKEFRRVTEKLCWAEYNRDNARLEATELLARNDRLRTQISEFKEKDRKHIELVLHITQEKNATISNLEASVEAIFSELQLVEGLKIQ